MTGLTSNATILDRAIEASDAYDRAIRSSAASGEQLLFELWLDDLRAAADLFRPIHEHTGGVDGWVSLEVSPDLARDPEKTVAEAEHLHAWRDRPNLFIKIPGTPEGVVAIEEAIFLGVPVNVTLRFSPGQYVDSAKAYLRGIERRLAAGLDPNVRSVASLFVSRWDVAVASSVPAKLRNTLATASPANARCSRPPNFLIVISDGKRAALIEPRLSGSVGQAAQRVERARVRSEDARWTPEQAAGVTLEDESDV